MSEAVEPDNCDASPLPHNRIYQALTSEQEDLVGHIAYSLYKRNKVAYIESIDRDCRRPPTAEELDSFQRQACLNHSLDAYRNEAERVLSDFTSAILEDSLIDIQKSYEKNLVNELKKSRPFWTGVLQNIYASIGVIAITGLAIGLIWAGKYGLKEVIESIFQVDITPK